MLINQKKYKKKKYSSGELRFVRSELDSFIENGEVEIFLENDYPILELSIILKYYKLKGVRVKLVFSYLPYHYNPVRNRLSIIASQLLFLSRYRNVTTCPLVQVASGENSVSEGPFVTFSPTAQSTASV